MKAISDSEFRILDWQIDEQSCKFGIHDSKFEIKMSVLKEMAQGLGHLLFPVLCASCTRPLLQEEDCLCTGCRLDMPVTGFDAAIENEASARFAGRLPFKYATAFCHFTNDGLLQHLLHRLKYGGDKEMGIFLGKQAGYAFGAQEWISFIDVIIPVPLHPKKEKSRGYNQSALIAEGLAAVTGKQVNAGNLIRLKNTESQTRKSREARVANVQDAFALRDEKSLRGQHILLMDDVLTTGATLESAAAPLLRIPGVQISLATIGLVAL